MKLFLYFRYPFSIVYILEQQIFIPYSNIYKKIFKIVKLLDLIFKTAYFSKYIFFFYCSLQKAMILRKISGEVRLNS